MIDVPRAALSMRQVMGRMVDVERLQGERLQSVLAEVPERVMSELRRLARETQFSICEVVGVYMSTPDISTVEATLQARAAGSHV